MMFQVQHLRSLWLAAAIVLSACGAKPSPQSAPLPEANSPQVAPTSAPAVQPDTPLGAQPGAQNGVALVARAHGLFDGMPSYRLKLWFSQKGGTRKSVGRYEILGQQPRSMLINIVEGNEAGTKVLWRGGASATVRPPGFLSALTIDLALTDHRLLSVRDYTLAQADLHSMFSYMSDAANHVTQVAPDAVDITGPKLLPGCVNMHVTFDPATGLPKSLEMSDGKEVVYQLRIEQLLRQASVNMSI